MSSTWLLTPTLAAARSFLAFASLGFKLNVFFIHVATCTSTVRICGTNVRTFFTGNQSASPWPQINVFSSMIPFTQHSRSTGSVHGPRGVDMRSL